MRSLPKGVYDQLLTQSLKDRIQALPSELKPHTQPLSPVDAVEYLARNIAEAGRGLLLELANGRFPDQSLESANRLLKELLIDDAVMEELLVGITDAVVSKAPSPLIPLSQSALITNDQGINYHAVLRSELETADRVDFICPFIGNQGLNLIIDLVRELGPKLRVITTTYLGATNQVALERIAGTGAEIKIIYESSDQKTSLHAKAWIFHRHSGFSTATIGSSNLSKKALVEGLEWNVRLSAKDASQVFEELLVVFERLWADERYEVFDAKKDAERLKRALISERSETSFISFFADLQPLPHQQEALSELAYARLSGKNENLVVAATGTGKTLLSAFDYQRFCSTLGGRPNLLFVAHREDILRQSLGAFQAVMRDSNFGELNVGLSRATVWRHAFASVQSLSQRNLLELSKTHFDMIIIDEFHHAEAPTYLRLLDYFTPKQLIGLTATPERTDGRSVIDRFGSPTYELRLWHALERQLLCPFHYYGINDGTDLSNVEWTAGKYSDKALDEKFVDLGNERASLVIRELSEKVEDLDSLRAVAFCASIRHASYMAEQFNSFGIKAEALHSGLSRESREILVDDFRQGRLPIVCTVDLFNEGVDIPEINTVMFLRPTESATVFIQQMGRGLRNHRSKGALTVLDFVGQQNKKFRMDLRFGALTGLSRIKIEEAVKGKFSKLPPGCHIKLDRITEERVLKNLKEAVPTNTAALVQELRRMHAAGIPITLSSFLTETGIQVSDLYRGGRSFSGLKLAANLVTSASPESRRVGAFSHVDDKIRIENYREALAKLIPSVFGRMMAFTLSRTMDLSEILPDIREEMLELISALEASAVSRPPVAIDLPFCLHSSYSRDEIVSPFRDDPGSMRQGTFYVEELGLDIHLVTLNKSEREFSPTTRYADYFISPEQLHWESQSTTSTGSPSGQRLIHGIGRHLFFARADKSEDGRVAPMICLGFARPESYSSERPIKIVWKLEHAIPDHIFVGFRAAAG